MSGSGMRGRGVSGGAALRLPARAKLNLWLRVVGRRADGYHLLTTLFHALELHDDVAVALADQGIAMAITADAPVLAVPPGPGNLVEQALHALAERVGYRGGFRAQLHKRIPHGGGLGGGSSDAAAALRLGNALLGAPLAAAELQALAASLGADCAFFLRGGSQWGRGVGDELSPAQVAARHFVLVCPPFGCPTVAVYKTFAALWQERAPDDTVEQNPAVDEPEALLQRGFRNDLRAAAERVQPALAPLRQRVAELAGQEVSMTGSGSTLFVPFAVASDAQRCAQDLEPLAADGVRILVTRSAAAGVDAPTAI
ncbi:MAG: 4-(cytidine 5'-diphospho)-2-C-methyl-D-erythritol kinase [Planctomycetes bacterium]|nr:4-(cytidine 5'-diphospho)-2-C-methyl-D-erythritol kinase [Planctomycetota bacterium]